MDTELDMTHPNCTLSEAVDMVRRFVSSRGRTMNVKWILAHVAYTTGWSADQIEAAYDAQCLDWCAHYGYDYT